MVSKISARPKPPNTEKSRRHGKLDEAADRSTRLRVVPVIRSLYIHRAAETVSKKRAQPFASRQNGWRVSTLQGSHGTLKRDHIVPTLFGDHNSTSDYTLETSRRFRRGSLVALGYSRTPDFPEAARRQYAQEKRRLAWKVTRPATAVPVPTQARLTSHGARCARLGFNILRRH
jgi:hypothetical protein